MKYLLLFLFIISCYSTATAQPGDFILLRKKGKTIRRLFAGQYVTAAIDSAGPYDLLIKEVANDSVRLMGYSLVQNGTSYGGIYIDTADRYYIKKPYGSITAFYSSTRNKKFNLTGSGATLMAAGTLGLLMTGINAAYLKEPLTGNGRPLFAAGSAVLIGAGYSLVKASSGPLAIGKKYKLVYVKMGS